MEKQEFLEKLTDILDCEEELAMDTMLEDVEEWDSLGVITFLAELAKYASSPVKADDVKAAKKVGDLYALLG